MNIYVLLLEDRRVYVGRTESPRARVAAHLSGDGAAYTKLYKPVDLLDFVENADKFDEDKYVLRYMEKYGVDNVRGGSYAQLVLSPAQRASVEQQLRNANDLCLRCGRA